MKILIIEDDLEVSNFIRNSFLNDSNIVDFVDNGVDGSYMARINYYDVIIVDYSLPKKSGLSVCSEIRAGNCHSLIIFLSMNHSIQNKVQCLEAGADDYMTKPFAFEELNARVKALMRRPKEIEDSVFSSGDLILDTKKNLVQRGNISIYLTKTEYNLLTYMIKNKGIILSRGMIMEHVWNAGSDPLSNTVEAHLANLRRKLFIDGRPEIIKNIAGRGYIIDP